MQTLDPRLQEGVASGIISLDQASRLEALWREGPIPAGALALPATGDEPFAFFRGFRDVFLSIGIIILVSGFFALMSQVFNFFDAGRASAGGLLTILLVGGGLLAFGQVVTQRLRMPLASLVLASGFSLSFAGMVVGGLSLATFPDQNGLAAPVIAGLSITAGALVYYALYSLPVSLGIAASGVIFAVLRLYVLLVPQDSLLMERLVYLVLGLILFAIAMAFDISDPERQTRRSENAFWLHLAAAPLIARALTLSQDPFALDTLRDAGIVTGLVAVLGLVALLIDRRAFLISALVYLGAAISTAISEIGLLDEARMAITLLVLGGFVVALALGWHPLRRMILSILPDRLALALPRVQEG